MKVLVTGANGMLGQDLCPILEDNGYEVIEASHSVLDVTLVENIIQYFEETSPDLVIHCAAYTNVDGAETEYEKAYSINSKGTENIAKVSEKFGAVLVYISTDYVFDGQKGAPYKPEDKPNPINNYGLTKLKGEEAVKQFCSKYYIIRTSWLYGHHGKNFVETMLSLKANDEIRVVDDQIGCPTWTVELAEAIVKIIHMPYGIYHACSSGETSWYEFAKEIFKLQGLEVNLLPCKTEDYPRPARRPKYSVMDNCGLIKIWKTSLEDYLSLRVED